MKRMIAAVAVCAVFGAGYIAGSLNSFTDAHAQQLPGGGSGFSGGPLSVSAVTPSGNGSTQFYAVDSATRTLMWCKSEQGGKPSCARQSLP